ncbi:MAG: dTDP-4-dehydrorhamnose reductase family protein [Nitratireductor sp.]
MRILILGVSGLIGHKLYQKLKARFGDVHGTLHGDGAAFAWTRLFDGSNIFKNVDVRDFDALEKNVLSKLQPDVILNCAGLTKRRPEMNDIEQTIAVNALFPHRLARWAKDNGKRVIHFSTDCVFDGSIGNYNEESPTTGKDLYGQSKAIGEIRYDHTLTIRSSFVGQELSFHSELLGWFLQQCGQTIKGFTNAWYTGISTIEMCRIVGDIIENQPKLNGLHQLSVTEPVSKYELLCMARDAYDFDVEIIPDGDFVIKPTLDSSLLRSKMDIVLPSWPEMIAGLAAEKEMYKTLS